MQRTLAAAVTLAALSLSLLAASTAGAAVRTEFFGIAQGQLDAQDRAGDGRRPGPDGPLHAQVA